MQDNNNLHLVVKTLSLQNLEGANEAHTSPAMFLDVYMGSIKLHATNNMCSAKPKLRLFTCNLFEHSQLQHLALRDAVTGHTSLPPFQKAPAFAVDIAAYHHHCILHVEHLKGGSTFQPSTMTRQA